MHVRASAAFTAMVATMPEEIGVTVAYGVWQQILKGGWRVPSQWRDTLWRGDQVWLVAFVDSGNDSHEGHYVVVTLRRANGVLHMGLVDDIGAGHGWMLMQQLLKSTVLMKEWWFGTPKVGPYGAPPNTEEAGRHLLKLSKLGAVHVTREVEVWD